jgi:hypothetical protein
MNTPARRGVPGPRGDGLGDVLERASRARRSQRALVRRIERQILCRRPAPEAETPAPTHQVRGLAGTRRKFACPPAPPEPGRVLSRMGLRLEIPLRPPSAEFHRVFTVLTAAVDRDKGTTGQ